MQKRHKLPVWAMGLTNLSYGLYGGVVAFAVPQLLGERHVPEATIAGITAVAYSPGFWAFLLSPVLDVRFTRRCYATVLALIEALTLLVAFLNLDRLGLVETMLTLGFCAAYLYQSAVGGWLSSITDSDEGRTISVWITVGNLGGFGIMAMGCNQLIHHLAAPTVAIVLGLSVILPTAAFSLMQAPVAGRRIVSESFGVFFGELVALAKRREVLIALVLFAAPAGTFSLTNFLASRGDDFHASPGFVGLVGGLGVTLGSMMGCLTFPSLSRHVPLRALYLCVGFIGAICTLCLIFLPHVPASYATVLIAENLFQSLAITTSIAITMEIIGRDNPLSSTTFCFITSAYGAPISYMLYVDSYGFARGNITGSLAIDAVTGLIATVILGLILIRIRSKALALPSATLDETGTIGEKGSA